jgi:hypothetical protein
VPRRMAEVSLGENGSAGSSKDAPEPSVWTGGCAGHDSSMRVSESGDYILKPSSGQERVRLEELMQTELRKFVPGYKGTSVSPGRSMCWPQIFNRQRNSGSICCGPQNRFAMLHPECYLTTALVSPEANPVSAGAIR